MNLQAADPQARCDWLLVNLNAWPAPPGIAEDQRLGRSGHRAAPTDKNDQLVLLRRAQAPAISQGSCRIGSAVAPMGATAPALR